MPQLDHVSYFSQFFWVSLLFLGFYLVLVQVFLPRIATILKVRKKLIILSVNENQSESTKSKSEDITPYDLVLSKSLRETKELLLDANKQTNQWTSITHEEIVNKHLKQSYTKYVESLGDILGKKYVLQSLLK